MAVSKTLPPGKKKVGPLALIVGCGTYVKPANVAVPIGVVTDTEPVVPPPTTAVMVKGDTSVNDAAGVPPKVTADVLSKSVPVIVTVVPFVPAWGVKPVITGLPGICGLFW